MNKLHSKRILAVSLVAAAIFGASATSASAAEKNGSDIPVYLIDAITEETFPATAVHPFDYDVVVSASATNPMARFQCSADTEIVRTFISPVGSERLIQSWTASAPSGMIPGSNKEIQQYPMTLSANINGSVMSVKANGGTYSAGLACLKYNGVAMAASGLWFATIDVKPVTGEWTARAFETPVVVPPVDTNLTGEIALEATTVTAPEGVLSLSVPTGASATIGSPTLVDGLSTSTGTLGQITVNDGRVQSKAGWTLTTTVADFVNKADATNTIPAKQLGVAPKVVSTTAAGVTTAPAQVAGSATYPSAFATATANTAVGTTVLDADLKFVAPADKLAGTYTSKMTLTLASK
ncbi:hypothetical protein B0I08_106100 [Glaciihabitans tibetensis]|uniref:WxL domain-containing protein n=1 Tax=Glaciihabitans tibetensis TaxID=1266600 RepID=A0A2T0VBI9_9MICO|nr:hypothetical protein [Glaciihabitans tibetensis]PRY67493.1 hypothetical protein B0I08_106100 [Glaciihabitans tibetensis]